MLHALDAPKAALDVQQRGTLNLPRFFTGYWRGAGIGLDDGVNLLIGNPAY
jgi:hypothetical protein